MEASCFHQDGRHPGSGRSEPRSWGLNGLGATAVRRMTSSSVLPWGRPRSGPASFSLPSVNAAISLAHANEKPDQLGAMSTARANSMLPAMLIRAGVCLPPMLGTALAAGHADHHTITDVLVQAALLFFMAALLVHVIISVVAILREREAIDPLDGRAGRLVSELDERPVRTAPQGKMPAEGQANARRRSSRLCPSAPLETRGAARRPGP